MPIAPWLKPPVDKTSNIRAEVIAVDPEWPRTSRWHAEYRFKTVPGFRYPGIYEDGERVFYADYTTRGAYNE